MKPLCIDLFCGLGGFSDGFLAEGYDCIGFDVERHDYSRACPMCDGTGICNGIPDCLACNRTGRIGTGGYPGQLVLQDVLTLHGSQFRNADCIVASPPCQEFSYMAMPWKRAKAIAAALRGQCAFPEGYTGSRTVSELTALFDACFRIQREASEAAGRYIPLVVENVKGAQPWVGRANANFGSFYLWGDVRSVGGRIVAAHRVRFGADFTRAYRSQKHNPDGTQHGTGSWFAVADSKNRGARKPDALTEEFNGHDDPRRGRETTNGSWFAMGANGKSNLAPDGRKVPMNFHEHEKTGKPGRSFQSAAVDGLKNPGMTSWSDFGRPGYRPAGFNVTAAQRYREECGVKQEGSGAEWFDKGICKSSSRSNSRKAASAQIAKIPLELSSYIARSFRPQKERIA